MRIRLEREERFGGDIVSRVAVEIESDDPSYALRKAKELLAHISEEEPEITGTLKGSEVVDQGAAGADGL